MKTVIAPESDLLREISRDLNRKVPGTGDWKTVAWKLGIPYQDYIRYATSEGKPSPTREVLDKVVTDRPMITIHQTLYKHWKKLNVAMSLKFLKKY